MPATKICCHCKLPHEVLFFRYENAADSSQPGGISSSQQQTRQLQNNNNNNISGNNLINDDSPTSVVVDSPASPPDGSGHGPQFRPLLHRAPDAVRGPPMRSPSIILPTGRGLSVGGDDTAAVGDGVDPLLPGEDALSSPDIASSSSSPPASPASAADLFCHMCYVILFRQLPNDSHAVAPRKPWTWMRFREAGFAFPEENETLSTGSTLIVNTGGTLSCVLQKDGLLAPEPLYSFLATKMETFQPLSTPQDDEGKNTTSSNATSPPPPPPLLVLESERAAKNPSAPYIMLENPSLMIDSTKASFDEWNLLAMIVSSRRGKYKAFVIIHGTDTLAFSASALTFALFDLQAPVVVTGSQTPLRGARGMLRGSTDATMNLLGAIDFAQQHSHLHGVFIFFHNKIMLGSRVVKAHSQNYDGFDSPNVGVVGYYNGHFTLNERLLELVTEERNNEVEAIAAHVKRFESYYEKHFSRAVLSWEKKLKKRGGKTLGEKNKDDDETPANSNMATPVTSSAEEALACSSSGSGSGGGGGIPRNAQHSDIIPFFDPRHDVALHRFHREAHCLVFNTRPGNLQGATPLIDVLLHHGIDKREPLGLIVRAYGAGNAQPKVADTLRWAREFANIPCVWTSQCYAGASETHYSVGLSSEHGVNVFDMTFEACYCRMLLAISQHIFAQGQLQETGEVDMSKFRRTKEYRDAVEDWMSQPFRLCMTVPPEHHSCYEKKSMAPVICSTVRDSSVAMYTS